jgi:hypothetical protein
MVTEQDTTVVTFGILGPLTVTAGDSPVPMRAPKVRIILAYLLLRNNRVVPTDELIDGLWGESSPRGSRNALQTYVMRLRQALGDAGDIIRTQPPGYLIAVPDDAVDLGRFRGRMAQSRAAAASGDLHTAADQMRLGLTGWRSSDVPVPVFGPVGTGRRRGTSAAAIQILEDSASRCCLATCAASSAFCCSLPAGAAWRACRSAYRRRAAQLPLPVRTPTLSDATFPAPYVEQCVGHVPTSSAVEKRA